MIKRSIDAIFIMANGIERSESCKPYKDGMVQGVSIDSRTLQAGNLFIPIVRNDDGHKYIKQAFEKGAIASLWQADHCPAPDGWPLIFVDNTLMALQNIAKAYRRQVLLLRLTNPMKHFACLYLDPIMC